MRSNRDNNDYIVRIIVLTIFTIALFPSFLRAQDPPPLKDLRVTGNAVQFIYSTLNHYDNGIRLEGRTTIRIRYQYTGHPNWELRLNADDTVIAYEGASEHDIPLSDLTLEIDAPVGVTVTDPFTLTNTPQVLVSGGGGEDTDPAEFIITISYELPEINNKPEGVYFVNLYFLLVEQGG